MEKGIEHNPQVDYNKYVINISLKHYYYYYYYYISYEELDVVQMRHATITFYNDKVSNKCSTITHSL